MLAFNHKSGKHITVDDAKIYYEEHGDKSAPVILFLHGGMNNMELFNPLLEALPEKFRVIGIDSRGQGKSTLGSHDLTYEVLQKEVEAVLKHLGINELTIVGFSNGGTIAYRLAGLSNLKVNKLLIIGSPWNTEHTAIVWQWFSKITLDDWKDKCAADYEQYLNLNPEPDIEKMFAQIMCLAEDKAGTRPNEAVKNITCKTLVVRGEHDPIVSEESFLEFCKLVKTAKMLTIPDAGHEIVVTDELVNFLVEYKL